MGLAGGRPGRDPRHSVSRYPVDPEHASARPILLHDGRAPTLQEQALAAIHDHYQNTVEPTAAQLETIAEFQRTNAHFFSSDDLKAFAAGGPPPELPPGNTPAEQRGRTFLVDAPFEPPSKNGICALCHGGPMLNRVNRAHSNFGNLGRQGHRSVLHDNGAKTLRDAVAHYQRFFNFTEAEDPVGSATLGGMITLTDDDVDDIVAYLQLLRPNPDKSERADTTSDARLGLPSSVGSSCDMAALTASSAWSVSPLPGLGATTRITPTHALADGTRLGSYEILSALGAGGMGEVYRARDTRLDRNVAIKILPQAFFADAERVARFQREAKVLASLNHPHIAAIYGLDEADGVRALVMELVEGEDLAQRLTRGPIPLDEALPIANQIAEALEAAHEQGIIHRDLKPANIKLRPDGTVKVLDFGLAKAVVSDAGRPGLLDSPTVTAVATRAGTILGTAPYMSPEQAKGRPVDRRTDIWAFGVVMYELLTGTRAFRASPWRRPCLTC